MAELIQVGLQNNIPEFANRLERLLWSVQSRYPEKIKGAVAETTEALRRWTPRHTGRMAAGWRAKTYGGGPKSRVPVAARIWNIYAHSHRWRYQSRRFRARSTNLQTGQINTRSVAVRTDGRTVLATLEYGSAPHVIRAAHTTATGKPGFLAFRPWGVGSARAGSMVAEGMVFTRQVHHPGTRAYGMIRRARAFLRGRVQQINRETAVHARAIMAGRA